MKVDIHDQKTDKVDFYPSIYKTALAFEQNPGVIGIDNGKSMAEKVRDQTVN